MYTSFSQSTATAEGCRRVQAASMGGGSSGDSKTAAARILGSGSAGVFELALFHPFDTAAKRLMSWEGRIIVAGHTMTNLNNAVFRNQAAAAPISKWLSLFPGVTFGAAYKVLQRAYKFGGQPFVRDFLTQHYQENFENAVGKKNGKTMIYATAGSIMGVGEIVLLPLDVLKIKAQTNPEAFKGRGLFKIFAEEGWGLYRGATWTAARNAPGSFALFGGSAAMKDYVFKLEKYSDATFFQDSMASIAGAVASISVAQPLDVIKTRIQKRDFKDKTSGMSILRDLVKNEGFGAFFKGLTPKLIVIGPKLVFSFTIAQQLMSFFERRF
ncbi:hypothetical protein NSK_005948 [Nannochloropsis salina CCMP1776]|uniref:Mitochondrial carrier protein n=1 Tax=Nannochloropsis salina CCMP1776 TaxID=1027361 RepID=A0A4D9CZF2_9STRA|nr:hypothetical protein NSK_005948 [Nannochloropsis salina CCMP1776]|eukprot:TFJ82755.1 hypothetical protein NSK_005948 [Nannochloropsis salina CCMP1776]